MVRSIIKRAGKPLRLRVETFAFTPDGKVLAGTYPDGGVGVFGGGVDGDSPEAAAKKEFREEGGRRLLNVQKIRGVRPAVQLWKDEPLPGMKETPKHKARREQFSGSKTIFMMGEVGGKAKVIDGSKLKDVRPKPLDDLIKQQRAAMENTDPALQATHKARLQVLERLRAKTAAAVTEVVPQEEALYAPEIYGHEAGHKAYQTRMGRFGKALDLAGTVGNVAGLSSILGGVVANKPEFIAGGSLLSAASDIPRLVEETAASRHSLKELREQLTPEEYQTAKKRLRAAGATYYLPPAVQGVTAGLGAAGLATGNVPLQYAGVIGQLASPAIRAIGQHIAEQKLADPSGKRLTKTELQELHSRMAPDIPLHASEKPFEGGAFYMAPQKGRFGKWLGGAFLEDPGLGLSKEEQKDFLSRGGIYVGKTFNKRDLLEMNLKGQGATKERINKALKKFDEKQKKREEKAKAKS